MATQVSIPGQMLLDDDVLTHPYDFYRRLIREAPVWHIPDTDIYVVSSFEAVTEACRRTKEFSSNLRYFLYRDERGLPAREPHGWGNTQILATADPPFHAQHKKVISRAFSPNRIAQLESQIAERTHHYLAPGLDENKIEFMQELANRIPIEVVSDLIAFRQRNTDALLRMAMVQTEMLAGAFPREKLLEKLAYSDDTQMWIVQQLQDAMQEPGDGILGALARGVSEGEVEMMVAIVILSILFAAGGKSTSSLIGNAVYLLATNPKLQSRLRGDPRLIPQFVEEALRLESPFRHHMRVAATTATLGGIEIPEGATLLLMWSAANRDPAAFDCPDQIDLVRPRRHVAFGSGIHVCLGNTLARLEARVILETLLASTATFELDPSEPPTQVPSLAVRWFETLPLLMQGK
jgi:cytochrome P450